jgi:hypothetical protein
MFFLEKKIKVKNLFILFSLTFLIFFWDIKFFNYFSFRELILISFPVLIYDISKSNFLNFKKNFRPFFLIFFFLLLIIFHLIFNITYDNSRINLYNLLSILGLSYLIFFLYFYHSLIKENIFLINIIFLTVYIPSLLFSKLNLSTNVVLKHTCSGLYNITNKFIFLENSHLAMMFVPCFSFLFFYFKNKNIILLFLLFLLSLIFFFLNSITLFFGLLIFLLLSLIYDFNFFFKKIFILFVILTFFFIVLNKSILYKGCYKKILSSTNITNYAFQNDDLLNFDKKEYEENSIIKKNDFSLNLSSAVFVNALEISFHTLNERFFGWGLNRYENAFNYYMNNSRITPYFVEVYTLNYNDGSGNLPKLFTEFGIFTFFIFPVIIKFMLAKSICVPNKIFFLTIIFIQMIRGAGYFNGGFAFALIFILFEVLSFYEKKNS